MAKDQVKSKRSLGVLSTSHAVSASAAAIEPVDSEAWSAISRLHQRLQRWSATSAKTPHALGNMP